MLQNWHSGSCAKPRQLLATQQEGPSPDAPSSQTAQWLLGGYIKVALHVQAQHLLSRQAPGAGAAFQEAPLCLHATESWVGADQHLAIAWSHESAAVLPALRSRSQVKDPCPAQQLVFEPEQADSAEHAVPCDVRMQPADNSRQIVRQICPLRHHGNMTGQWGIQSQHAGACNTQKPHSRPCKSCDELLHGAPKCHCIKEPMHACHLGNTAEQQTHLMSSSSPVKVTVLQLAQLGMTTWILPVRYKWLTDMTLPNRTTGSSAVPRLATVMLMYLQCSA